MKCRITTKAGFHRDDTFKFKEQYIKEHHLDKNPKEMKKFLKLFKEIYEYDPYEQRDLSKFNNLFNNNEFPMPICNYKSFYKKDGFFIINYRDMSSSSDIESTSILILIYILNSLQNIFYHLYIYLMQLIKNF